LRLRDKKPFVACAFQKQVNLMKYSLSRLGMVVVFAVAGCMSGKTGAQSAQTGASQVSAQTPATQPAVAQSLNATAPATRPGAATPELASLSPQTGLQALNPGQGRANSAAVGPEAEALAAQLEGDAFKDIHVGDFGQSAQLLDRAANLSQDPNIREMAGWVKDFDVERQSFKASRHQQYEQAVSYVHLLLDHKADNYALDEARLAYLLSDDQDAFRNEKWMGALKDEAVTIADQLESSQQWLKALGVYSDLSAIYPSDPVWKDKMKLAARRVRLLMVYTPDRYQRLQDSEAKDRMVADNIIHPSTQPSVAAATSQPDSAETADNFMVDWHDVTHGIEYDMLWDSLVKADQEYYRDIDYQTLLRGGLMGLQAVVTTSGLEDSFPGLADEKQRKLFLTGIDECMKQAADASPDRAKDVTSEALNTLRDLNKKTVNIPEEVFISEFADGAFAKLDPFSSMIWPYDLAEFQKMTQGEFGGVGIQIEEDDQGNLKVVSPLEDTPALRAGIRAGDIVTQINGKNVKGISIDRAVKTITGVPGTTVTLTVRSTDGEVKDYILRREMIKVASIKGFTHKSGGGWDYFIDPKDKVAYIRLTNFTKSTSDDLDKALSEMKGQGARAMILDLRWNPGGLLQSATDVVDKFISSGVIVSTHADRPTDNPPTVIDARADDTKTDLPMVVLVNQLSASASEIVSGALKDHQRAILVGERTFGKGSVQMLFPLANRDSYLRLTTSHYYLPSGRCIHREEDSKTWGVDPDYTIEMTPDQMSKAMDVRQDMDVLHDPSEKPQTRPTTIPDKADLLAADPQLAGACLLLKLELAGMPPQ
jgi:carboxyl-terminal processing protease